MIQQPERSTKHDRTPGWSAAIVRDLWIADLLARDAGPAADGERPEPEEPLLTALMDHRHVDIAALRTPPERTWLWSDLHLSDRTVLEAWRRPFRHMRELDRRLLREWRRAVKLGDTSICLGDVAHPDVWRDRRTMLDIRNCHGQRILILGNHDVNDADALREAGFRDQFRWRGRGHRTAASADPLPAEEAAAGDGEHSRTPPRRRGADTSTRERQRGMDRLPAGQTGPSPQEGPPPIANGFPRQGRTTLGDDSDRALGTRPKQCEVSQPHLAGHESPLGRRGRHRRGASRSHGCGETLGVTGDPPLLVAHMPMTDVPHGTVNVVRTRAQQRAVARRTYVKHPRRAHRAPTVPARRGAAARAGAPG